MYRHSRRKTCTTFCLLSTVLMLLYLNFRYQGITLCIRETDQLRNHDSIVVGDNILTLVRRINNQKIAQDGVPAKYGASDTANLSDVFDYTETSAVKHSAVFVLLVTYGRSGSSWLGNITGQGANTFYVFEPLQKILPQGHFKEKLVCFYNNTCRHPRTDIERQNILLSTVYKLFTCQTSELHPFTKEVFKENLRSPEHIATLKKCLNTSSSEICLKEIDNLCSLTTHRVLKTIRISMDLVTLMMSLWRNLKVVHLVRDPRAITYSRLQADDFSMSQSVFSHTKDTCSRMLNDVLITFTLQSKYPERITLVFYEALAEKPQDGAKFIYKFLHMSFNETVLHSVNYSAHAINDTTTSEYYSTMRQNSSEVAFYWRSKTEFLRVQVIDHFCKDLYLILGYVSMNTTNDLRSISVPSRRKINIKGFV